MNSPESTDLLIAGLDLVVASCCVLIGRLTGEAFWFGLAFVWTAFAASSWRTYWKARDKRRA